MSRHSVIESSRVKIQYERIKERDSDRKNDIASTFTPQIHEVFKKDILPGNFGQKFEPKQARLYCNRRVKHMKDVSYQRRSFTYEMYFHSNFWPGITKNRKKLFIIEGKEGCGKSTFMRYYFDCFIPNLISWLKLNSINAKTFKREVDQHVKFYIDLEHIPDEKVESEIYKSLINQITEKYKNITSDDNYAMCSRKVDWNQKIYKNGYKSASDINAFKSDYIRSQYLNDNQVLAEEAIWYLGHRKNKRGKKNPYISIILDNLDQKYINVQKQAVSIILKFFSDDELIKSIWKIILLMRPETKISCGHLLDSIDYFYMPLGDLVQYELLRNRSKNLKELVKKTSQMVDRNIPIKEGKSVVIVYDQYPNYESLQKIDSMMNFDYRTITSDSPFQKLRFEIKELVQKFCNGNVDRFLAIRKRLLESTVMADAIAQEEEHQYEPFPDYIFISSLLTGDHDYFLKDDQYNYFVNIYDSTGLPPSAYTLLIGTHVFFLLSRGAFDNKSEMLNHLKRIGYQPAEVERCLETFCTKELFKRTYPDNQGDYMIYLERDVIDAYCRLITRPAYTDNMALVTSVESEFLKEMKHTLPLNYNHFVNRSHTTIKFLTQIRDDEDEIRIWARDSHHPEDSLLFKKNFDELRLPSIYRKAAFEYKRRLEQIRNKPGRLGQVVSQKEWKSIVENDIISVDEEDIDKPLVAILP